MHLYKKGSLVSSISTQLTWQAMWLRLSHDLLEPAFHWCVLSWFRLDFLQEWIEFVIFPPRYPINQTSINPALQAGAISGTCLPVCAFLTLCSFLQWFVECYHCCISLLCVHPWFDGFLRVSIFSLLKSAFVQLCGFVLTGWLCMQIPLNYTQRSAR